MMHNGLFINYDLGMVGKLDPQMCKFFHPPPARMAQNIFGACSLSTPSPWPLSIIVRQRQAQYVIWGMDKFSWQQK